MATAAGVVESNSAAAAASTTRIETAVRRSMMQVRLRRCCWGSDLRTLPTLDAGLSIELTSLEATAEEAIDAVFAEVAGLEATADEAIDVVFAELAGLGSDAADAKAEIPTGDDISAVDVTEAEAFEALAEA